MEARVVSISRTLAAGGEEVGRLVADGLDFRYVDDEVIIRAAGEAGVSPATIAQVEHSRSLGERIAEAMSNYTRVEGASETRSPRVDREGYQALIRWVVEETANEGQAVFVAHGTSIALAAMSGILRVLVTASPEIRAERLMALTDVGEPQAKKPSGTHTANA